MGSMATLQLQGNSLQGTLPKQWDPSPVACPVSPCSAPGMCHRLKTFKATSVCLVLSLALRRPRRSQLPQNSQGSWAPKDE